MKRVLFTNMLRAPRTWIRSVAAVVVTGSLALLWWCTISHPAAVFPHNDSSPLRLKHSFHELVNQEAWSGVEVDQYKPAEVSQKAAIVSG